MARAACEHPDHIGDRPMSESCGCRVEWVYNDPPRSFHIIYCPLHKAARATTAATQGEAESDAGT